MNVSFLVQESKKGDILSFMKLLSEKKEFFYKICFNYMKNKYDAEDCFSEASIKGFEKIKQLKNEDKFYTWFTTILVNVCRSHHRKKVELQNDESLEEIASIFSYTSIEDKIIIENLLQELKSDEREILVLKYLKDYSIKEVASIMKLPQNTIKTKIYRSLNFLRLKYRRLENEC